MDAEIGDSVVVGACQVAQGVLDAVEEFAWFAAVSAVDCCEFRVSESTQPASLADADL